WRSFIELNTYDILQQLQCLPYTMEPVFNYELQLIIDVSEKSSHFGLSLMVYKKGMQEPFFSNLIHPKTNGKETINKVILEKYILNLFNSLPPIVKHKELKSLLVLRDGKDCGEEYLGICNAVNKLKEQHILSSEFAFDFIEYHKTSLKNFRMWDANNHI